MSDCILSVAFSRDNQSVFISDYKGNIKRINWQAGAKSINNFDFSEEPKKVGKGFTFSICLTKDEKYLLVGSHEGLLVFETATREIIKEFQLTDVVQAITLIKDGKTAIIAEINGNLSVINIETLEIFSIANNITKNGGNECILVI